MSSACQTWLAREDAAAVNVYISVNTIRPGRASRRRVDVGMIRHVFLDVDRDGAAVLSALSTRRDVPSCSYVLHSSSNRMHILWRVRGFSIPAVEVLQKHLAHELGTDLAATSCSQLTRIPGFINWKRRPGYRVTAEYRSPDALYTPADFPKQPITEVRLGTAARIPRAASEDWHALERARRYLSALPPAIAGQHGDAHTFRTCCRLVRGFALSDHDALTVLQDWNARCDPPWPERELVRKLVHARRYGREPIGGLLERR
jgi:hypothetical protein